MDAGAWSDLGIGTQQAPEVLGRVDLADIKKVPIRELIFALDCVTSLLGYRLPEYSVETQVHSGYALFIHG
jgi:hypothetical protein